MPRGYLANHVSQVEFNDVFGISWLQHTETFDNANVGNVAETLKVPTDMLGSWKAVIEVGSERDGVNVNECTMAPFLLEDV